MQQKQECRVRLQRTLVQRVGYSCDGLERLPLRAEPYACLSAVAQLRLPTQRAPPPLPPPKTNEQSSPGQLLRALTGPGALLHRGGQRLAVGCLQQG
jgi:hypothetical protein